MKKLYIKPLITLVVIDNIISCRMYSSPINPPKNPPERTYKKPFQSPFE